MNKKYYLAIGILSLIASLSTSCSDEIETAIPSEKAELKITAEMEGYDKADTKAIIEGASFDPGTQIGVCVLNGSGAAYDGQTCTNLLYKLESSSWTCSSTTYLSASPGTVYAYYPYNSSWNIGSIAMTASTSPGGGTDYMYATSYSVSQITTTAALTMKHALTAVKVSIKRGTYKGTGKVTALTWKSASAGTGGTLNAKNGGITNPTGGNTAFDAGLTESNTITVSSDTQKDYTFMAVPMNASGTVTFSVTMDGKTFTVTTPSAVTMASGLKYQYLLVMDAKEMTLSKVTLTDWTGQALEKLTPSF